MQEMKRLLITIGMLSLIAGSALTQPKLAIPSNRFEFGSVPQNSTVTQYFWFKSIGTDTVRIREIKTGCDCTTIPLEQDWLAPGDSLRVGVYWDTERKVGNSGRYPYIYVDGQHEAERLFLTADVVLFPDSARPISIKPYKAELSRMAGFSIDSVVLKLTNHSDRAVALTVVSPPMPEYQVRKPDSLMPNSAGTIVIHVSPEFREKEFSRSLTVAFDGGVPNILGRLTIPIRRKVIS